MTERIRTLLLAVWTSAAAAALIAGTYRLLDGPIAKNRALARMRQILKVTGAIFDDALPDERIVEIFGRAIRFRRVAELELYEYVDAGYIEAVAVNFEGPGYRDVIRGVIAFDPDFRTIRGVAFYDQRETPGLGGEIQSEAFTRRFSSKRLSGDDDVVTIVRPGEACTELEIDGITGATMTCDALGAMIGETIRKIRRAKLADETAD